MRGGRQRLPGDARDANREDRWRVARANPARLGWYARPYGVGVFADLRTRRQSIFFPTWRQAIDYALRRIYAK